MASGYGYRTDPFTKKRRFHYGMDFSARKRTPIYATGNGIVKRADNRSSGYGKHIRIDHGFGYISLYAHLSKYNVRRGQRVKRGDIIGYVGNTGRSVGPHLHYEFIKNKRKVNPLKVKIPSAHPVAKKDMEEFKCLSNYLKEIFNSHFLVDPVIVSRKPRQCNINRLSTGDKKKVNRM